MAKREAFRKEMETMQTQVGATVITLDNSLDKIKAMGTSLARSSQSSSELYQQLRQAKVDLMALKKEMSGSPAKEEIGERNDPTVQSRMWTGFRGLNSMHGPTQNHIQTIAVAKKQLAGIKAKVAAMSETTVPNLEKALQALGAPWIEGQALPKN